MKPVAFDYERPATLVEALKLLARENLNVKPIAGTASCQYHHLGVCVSGRLGMGLPSTASNAAEPLPARRRPAMYQVPE